MAFTQVVSKGKKVNNEFISRGSQYVYGTTVDNQVGLNGVQIIYANGAASGTLIGSGLQSISSGGKAVKTSIIYGGKQIVSFGGLASSTSINADGSQFISSGGAAVFTSIYSKGSQVVCSKGLASSSTIKDGGNQIVSSGGTATSTAVSSGGRQRLEGGMASNTTICSSGRQDVSFNGLARSCTISSFGSQYVSAGGSATYTVVAGRQYILNGGSACDTTIKNGVQYVEGRVSNTTVSSGGWQLVSSGGTATSTTISNGGLQSTCIGGITKYTTVFSGGSQHVAGQTSSSTISKGGLQRILYGGSAVNTFISSGGTQSISGKAMSTEINSGGIQLVNSSGAVTSTLIQSGGSQLVSSGGSTTNTILSGGTLLIASGGYASGFLSIYGGSALLGQAGSLKLSSLNYFLNSAKADQALMTINNGAANFSSLSVSLKMDNTKAGTYVLASGANLTNLNNITCSVIYGSKTVILSVGKSYTFSDGYKLALALTDASTDSLKAIWSKSSNMTGATGAVTTSPSSFATGTNSNLVSGAGNFLTDNTQATARTLGVNDSVSELVGFGDVADYYKITMENTGTLSLNLTGLNGNADLELYNTGGKLLKSSAAADIADENIVATSLLAGDYFVKVATAGNGNGVDDTDYTLNNTVSYFPTDTAGDKFAAAQKIAASGTVNEWLGFGDRDDYYRLELDTRSVVSLDLSRLSSNVNLYLYNSQHKLVAYSAQNGTSDESIAKTLDAGTYYARASLAGKDNTSYSLSFDVDSVSSGSLNLFTATSSPELSGSTHIIDSSNGQQKKIQGVLAS